MVMGNLKLSTVYLLVAIISLKLTLDYSYAIFVSPVFSYSGFYINFDLVRYVVSWFVVLVVSPFLRSKLMAIADYAALFWFALVVVPTLSLFGLDLERKWQPAALVVCALLMFIFFSRVRLPNFSQVRPLKDGWSIAVAISGLFVVALIFNYLLSGVSLNFNPAKVYEYRDANAERASGGLLSYLNIWTYKVFNIVLISLSLFHRKYFYALIFIFIQFFFFAASAHKFVLLMPFLVVSVYFYFRSRSSLLFIPVALTMLVAGSVLAYLVFGDIFLSSLFIRRLLFVPAHLNFVYYDFFSTNNFVFWSNSFLAFFSDYPYDENVAHTIGSYLGKPDMGANNGLVSSGYAQAGVAGVLIYTVLFSFLLRFAQYVVKNRFPTWFLLSVLVVPVSNILLVSDFMTTILTHGFGIAVVIVYLLSTHKKSHRIYMVKSNA